MRHELYDFLKTTLIGGATIAVPLLILLGTFTWMFEFVLSILDFVADFLPVESVIVGMILDLIALAVIIAICFFLGIAVKTGFGKFVREIVEKEFLERLPGYNTTWRTDLEKESRLALVRLFDNNTLVTAFVRDPKKSDGETYTVFIPSGPNPTSGSIYHVEKDRVFFVKASIEEGMRSVMHCGEGSYKLIKKYKKRYGVRTGGEFTHDTL